MYHLYHVYSLYHSPSHHLNLSTRQFQLWPRIFLSFLTRKCTWSMLLGWTCLTHGNLGQTLFEPQMVF